MQKIKISLLAPTRNRILKLQKFLDSIQFTCNDLNNIEVIIRVDNDDKTSISFLEEYKMKVNYDLYMILGERGGGYIDGPKWLESFLEKAKGQLIFYLADDAQFLTKDWDTILIDSYDKCKHGDKIVMFRTKHNQEENPAFPLFPVLTMEWIKVTGHFCQCYQVDTELHFLSKLINRNILLESITVFHDRPDHETGISHGEVDKTFVEGRWLESKKATKKGIQVLSWKGKKMIIDDAIKLYLHIHPQAFLSSKIGRVFLKFLFFIKWRYIACGIKFFIPGAQKVHRYISKYKSLNKKQGRA